MEWKKVDDKAEPNNKRKQQMMFNAHNCGNYVIKFSCT